MLKLIAIAESNRDLRSPIRSRLREIGTLRSLELPTGVADWLAASIHEDSARTPVLIAADESQSSAVESVAACLLSAWDSVEDPIRSQDTLSALRELARDVFKIDLLGRVGEVVKFDARQHELLGGGAGSSETAKIIRPGVAWSDGLRSRIIMRALVEVEQ